MPDIYCAGLSADMNTWASCLQETMFFGDALVMGALIFAIFVILIWKMRLPGEFALAGGMLVSFGLYLTNPSDPFFLLMTASLIAIFGWICIVLIKRFLRE